MGPVKKSLTEGDFRVVHEHERKFSSKTVKSCYSGREIRGLREIGFVWQNRVFSRFSAREDERDLGGNDTKIN